MDYPGVPHPLCPSFLRLLSGGFPSLTAAMAENMADAIRHGIDAAKRMVVASSCSVVKRVTIPAHTMAVPNAAVAIARVTGLISYFILSLVSQDFMAFFHYFFLIDLTQFYDRRRLGPSQQGDPA